MAANAYVQAVAYRGDDIRVGSPSNPYQLDALDAVGPLDRQVVDACRFVARNMKTAAVKNLGRADMPQYDLEAVFEAIVNAVAHRDYSIHGSKVRLRLFENRLEIHSPGGIPNSLAVESLRYRQSARNEAVCSLLARCPIPDESWLTTPPAHDGTARRRHADHLGQQHGAFRQRAGDQSVRPLGTAADDLCGVWQWNSSGSVNVVDR